MARTMKTRPAALVLGVSTLLTGSALTLTGPVQAASVVPPVVNGIVQVSSVGQLEYIDNHQTQPISSGSSVTYMGASIELEPGTYDLAGDNWTPLGSSTSPFAGSFNGQGAVISGLAFTVSTGDTGAIGLFGVEDGNIENLALEDVQVRGQASAPVYIGDLAGEMEGGQIDHVVLEHSVGSAEASGGVNWGGLVGSQQGGVISDVSGAVQITVDTLESTPVVGGLVGAQEGRATISNVQLESTMTGQGSHRTMLGGLVGEQTAGGVVVDDHTSGQVAASTGQIAGGLVAVQSGGGTVNASDSTDPVSGGAMNGGLVGAQMSGGVVESSWALGTVSASTALSDNVSVSNGGLVGEQDSGGAIANSYAEGAVVGHGGLVLDGGLVGAIMGTGHSYIENSFETGPVSSGSEVGGIVGEMMIGLVSGAFALGNVTGASNSASYADGGLVGFLEGGTLTDSYAIGNVNGNGADVAGGILGEYYNGLTSGVYEIGSVSGAHENGGVVGVSRGGSGVIDDAVYLSTTGLAAIGSGTLGSGGSATAATLTQMTMPFGNASSPFSPWMTSPTWGQVSSIQDGLPFLPDDTVVTLSAPSTTVTVGHTVPITIEPVYDESTTSGLTTVAVSGISLDLSATTGTWAETTATSTSSPLGVNWTAPNTPQQATLSVMASGGFMAMVDLQMVNAPPSSTSSGTPFVLPTFLPEAVTINGVKGVVIANDGYNSGLAVANGSSPGYIEERAAVLAGASFNGEGLYSSYLSAILSGRGVGLQQHVSAVQQGQFAALYQKLGIIPTWNGPSISPNAAVAALQRVNASPLAIENYLVQLDGFSWTLAQAWVASHESPTSEP
ncbi:MAG: hypothetical protein OWU33_12025 [Firmicutes bacterium]|nr:hypothetical protein [Bacillota bacterium]